jgi:hypothetical protein
MVLKLESQFGSFRDSVRSCGLSPQKEWDLLRGRGERSGIHNGSSVRRCFANVDLSDLADEMLKAKMLPSKG